MPSGPEGGENIGLPLEGQLAMLWAKAVYPAIKQVVEGMTIAQLQAGPGETVKPFEPTYGSASYEEVKGEVEKVLPRVQERAKELGEVLKLVASREVDKLPEATWRRVDAIFDTIPNSAGLKEWNRKQVKGQSKERPGEGRYAHIVLYLLQDFRNSADAETLSTLYRKLTKEGRIAMEKALRDAIGDDFRFELMCKVGMKPYVFPPEQSPAHTTVQKTTEAVGGTWLEVTNEDGKRVYTGVDEAPPHTPRWEGNTANCYDAHGRPLFIIQYYGNNQPKIWLKQYDSTGKEVCEDVVNWYLGAKGMFGYYQDDVAGKGLSRLDYIDINRDQMLALKKFFRWERGKAGDVVVRNWEIIWDISSLRNKIEKAAEALDKFPASAEALNSVPTIKAALGELQKYVYSLPADERGWVLKSVLRSGLYDIKHRKNFWITEKGDGTWEFTLEKVKK